MWHFPIWFSPNFSASLHSLSFLSCHLCKLLIYRRIKTTTHNLQKKKTIIIRSIYNTSLLLLNKNPDFKIANFFAIRKEKIHAEVFILVKYIITFFSSQFNFGSIQLLPFFWWSKKKIHSEILPRKASKNHWKILWWKEKKECLINKKRNIEKKHHFIPPQLFFSSKNGLPFKRKGGKSFGNQNVLLCFEKILFFS